MTRRAADTENKRTIHNIAHRGASAYEPENTLRAFDRAIEMGATMLELDVHLSLDGHPVVIHDPDISRTTNGTGRVAELSLEQIKRFDAGLGEQGRNGIMITPELGCNIRPAVVTTNIPMATDKPIDIGVQDFCAHCKICAEYCPSNAIPMSGKEEVRGYRRYKVNPAKCNNFWTSNLGNMGCRLCISVCPQKVIFISDRINQQGYYPAIFNEDNQEDNRCIACVRCATICPDIAIEVYRD